jgi:hypothetical protein
VTAVLDAQDQATLTATVTSTDGITPQGTVTFYKGTSLLGAVMLQNGQAQLTTDILPPGQYTFTAVYSGDTNHDISVGTADIDVGSGATQGSIGSPSEVAGGTGPASPAFASSMAPVNQGRVTAGQAAWNASSPTEAQQALSSLPQGVDDAIASGSNGSNGNAGDDLVTGLGTLVGDLLVPDLTAYQGPGTAYAAPVIGPSQDAALANDWGGHSSTTTVISTATASSLGQRVASMSPFQTAGPIALPPAAMAFTPSSTRLVAQRPGWSTPGRTVSLSGTASHRFAYPGTDEQIPHLDALTLAIPQEGLPSDSVLDELAAAHLSASRAPEGAVTVRLPSPSPAAIAVVPARTDDDSQHVEASSPGRSVVRLAALGLAAGLWARDSALRDAGQRASRRLSRRRKSTDSSPGNRMS